MTQGGNQDLPAGALTGVTVLDLTRLLPGPYATQILWQFGAHVIKVEDTGQGDYARTNSPLPSSGFGPTFTAANRGKQSVTIHLKSREGLDAFMTLVKKADVLIEGFRPGVARRLGIDAASLHSVHPGLIYCSISGYGQKTQHAHLAGHDINYQGAAGLLSRGQGRAPVHPTALIADLAGGSYASVVSILVALLERQKTGRGRYIDLSITHSALLLNPQLAAYHLSNLDPAPLRRRFDGTHPGYRIYETSDGRHMTLGALESKFWDRFCDLAGCPEFMGVTESDDPAILALCHQKMEAIFRQRSFAAWSQLALEWDVCMAPVLTPEEAIDEAKAEQLPLFASFDSGTQVVEVLRGGPADLTRIEERAATPPPRQGQHNSEHGCA